MKQLLPLRAKEERNWQRYCIDSFIAIVSASIVTSIIYAFHLYPRIPDISLAYILIVMALASTRGLYAAILAALIAFFSFDFFLVPPLYTFTIASPEEWLALFVFLITAILTGQLASALRKRAEQANRQARETGILYELVRATNSEQDVNVQLTIIARAIVDIFSSWGVDGCAILLPDSRNKMILRANALGTVEGATLSPEEATSAAWVMNEAQTVEVHDVSLAPQTAKGYAPRAIVRSTAVSSPARHYVRMIPLKMGQKVVGVVRLSIMDDPRLFHVEKSLGVEREGSDPGTAFFWTFLDQAAAVIERARLRNESLQVELLRRTDALRAALLSSVSHDLRTPLSSIKAAASSLLQSDVQWDEEARRSFAIAIERETDRLNRLVGNLLDMSRIEGGALKLEKEWYPVDELIHDVLGHMQPVLKERTVGTDLPDNLPPVELDYLQMDQVLTNLIENAVRYTPPASPIEICARTEGHRMKICVADRGPGIPAGDTERIFDKFYRISGAKRNAGSTPGSGLGLAVCKGLVEAHGGHIWVEQREGGGALFCFTLPLFQYSQAVRE